MGFVWHILSGVNNCLHFYLRFSFLRIQSCILPGWYKFSLKPRNTPEIAGFYFLNAFWSAFQSGYVTLELPQEFCLQPWDSTNYGVQVTVLRSASHPYQVPQGCCLAPVSTVQAWDFCFLFYPVFLPVTPSTLLSVIFSILLFRVFVVHTGPFRQSSNFIVISCSAFYFTAIHSGHFLELYKHFLSPLSLPSRYVWSLKANFLGGREGCPSGHMPIFYLTDFFSLWGQLWAGLFLWSQHLVFLLLETGSGTLLELTE